MPFNPGDALREKFGVEEQSAERTIAPEEGLQEEETDFTKVIVGKVSARIALVHQQIYLAFVAGMVAAILAGRFAWDILDFLVNKVTQFILTVCRLILACLAFIARKIFNKIKELRVAARRRVRAFVKLLNHKIKMQ